MNSLFWERAHGGLTHLPIALIFAAAFFDALAFFCRHSPKRGEFKAIGYWLVIVGALGSFGAVFSGLVLSKGTIGGTGAVLRHHYFVWPAFTLIVGLATWRFLVCHECSSCDQATGAYGRCGAGPAFVPDELRALPRG